MLPLYGLLTKEDKKIIKKCYTALRKKKLKVVKEPDSILEEYAAQLKNFQMLQGYDALTLGDLVKVSHVGKECHLGILAYNATLEHVSRHGLVFYKQIHGPQAITIVHSQNDFGRVFIRPETVCDKIFEIFEPTELDFEEHSKFSNNYYMLATDEKKARANFNYDVLDSINTHKDLVIEIYNKIIINYKQKSLSPKNIEDLVDFTMMLVKHC